MIILDIFNSWFSTDPFADIFKISCKWMRKNLLLNINLGPPMHFDKIFKI